MMPRKLFLVLSDMIYVFIIFLQLMLVTVCHNPTERSLVAQTTRTAALFSVVLLYEI